MSRLAPPTQLSSAPRVRVKNFSPEFPPSIRSVPLVLGHCTASVDCQGILSSTLDLKLKFVQDDLGLFMQVPTQDSLKIKAVKKIQKIEIESLIASACVCVSDSLWL